MNRRITILLLCLCCAFPLTAQVKGLQFDHLQQVKGLGTRTITSIIQDNHGFIWLGTQDGLLRFDGYELKVYKNNLRNTNSLSDNNIRGLAKDNDGNIWIATQGGGLNKFDVRYERFDHFVHNPSDPGSISGNAVWSVLVDNKNNVWAGTWSNGLNAYDAGSKKFTRIDKATTPEPVLALLQASNGMIWFSTNGLGSYDPLSGKLKNFSPDPSDPNALATGGIRAILEDHEKKLWVGSAQSGLYVFDPFSGVFTKIALTGAPSGFNAVYALFEDSDKNLWVGGNGGLAILDPSRKKVTYYQNEETSALSLSNNSVRVIFSDNQQSVWIGNEGAGVNKVLEKKNFGLLQHDPRTPGSLSFNVIRSLYDDSEGRVWVGTQGGGLNVFDKTTGQFRRAGTGNDKFRLKSEEISSIYEDSNGIFWIGTWGDGLHRVDTETGEVRIYVNEPGNRNTLPDNRIQIVLEDDGFYWVGTENGLAQFFPDTEVFRSFGANQNNVASILGTNIQGKAFVRQQDGTVWSGTWFGLNRIMPDRKSVQHYTSSLPDGKNLSSDHVISLYEDGKGSIWLGTFGGGLNHLDIATGDVTHFTEEDGLPNNTVFGILADDHGQLWLSTNNGLSRFNPETKVFRNYDVIEGLQSNEFYWGAAHKNRDGTLLFGGVNGLNWFHPAEIRDNELVPPVVISDFQIFNKPVPIGEGSPLKESISFTRHITVRYDQSVLVFGFSALNYKFPEKNQYAYKLENFDPDWNFVGNKRTATYTNLDPGEYTFMVKGSNNDNLWNNEGAVVHITVLPPYWRTWWFYTMLALGAAGSIYGLFKLRLRKLKEDKAKMEKTLKDELDRAKEAMALQQKAILEEEERNKERNWTDNALSVFGAILSRSKDNVVDLSRQVLSTLTRHVGLAGGAIYIYNNHTEVLDQAANFGFENIPSSVSPGSGLVGVCYESKETSLLTDLPGSFFRISSGLGGSIPNTLLLVPLKSEEICLGVIELAAFDAMPEYKRKFVELLADRFTTTLNTTLMAQRTAQLLEESRVQAEELKVREEELKQNLEEMQAIQEDRDRKAAEIQKELEALRRVAEKTQHTRE
jgi:ligand-binding sensor domain-containing protein